MSTDTNLWVYIAHAGPVVKVVMFLLVAASVLSWAFIFQREIFFRKARERLHDFEQKFWSGGDLTQLYDGMKHRREELSGLENIFFAGFDAFLRARQPGQAQQQQVVMDSVQRAMRIADARERDKLEKHLPFLATVGSISPYVGLFGTVWGIMTALQALGSVQQATIAVVAPGISETLIATAMGLFAAIPAVIAYNRFNADYDRVSNTYGTFQEEFVALLNRQTPH
ncbi:MAG: protein TolQ [Pseudomonadota bacterium]|nr:protein TolQ [Pseudomonadota bacterium]